MLRTLAFLFTLTLGLAACGGHSHSHDHDQTNTELSQSKEYASAYICPMHCKGSGSESPGTCPVCGMDYVQNDAKDVKKTEAHDHSHDHDHGGDHSGHSH
ncbi:MAG: hypothetical protein HKN16_00500 [Saprospiraceae bacterium]|nr:hypothetical protein [Saprospiraceae bacterium]